MAKGGVVSWVVNAALTLKNKILTTPVISTFYKDTAKTKLMTVPDTASDTLAAIAATQTLTNKTLTAPVVTAPDLTFGVASHSYASAHADWTLSAAELKATILVVTLADAGANAIATPTAGKIYILVNTSGQAITLKASGQTGVAVANAKTAILRGTGTDFARVTADA